MLAKNPILTREERDALILVAVHTNSNVLSNREIGEHLGIPLTNVKALLHQACVKLGADNRGEAVFLALRHGEILITKFCSLEELAECLGSLGPEILSGIAQYIRQEVGLWNLQRKFNQIILTEKRLNTIFTNRERDVLILVGRGLTNKEIAAKLCLSTSAVRNFLSAACAKLGSSKRVDAFLLALKQGEIGFTEIFSLNEAIQVLAPLGAETIEKIAHLMSEKLKHNNN